MTQPVDVMKTRLQNATRGEFNVSYIHIPHITHTHTHTHMNSPPPSVTHALLLVHCKNRTSRLLQGNLIDTLTTQIVPATYLHSACLFVCLFIICCLLFAGVCSGVCPSGAPYHPHIHIPRKTQNSPSSQVPSHSKLNLSLFIFIMFTFQYYNLTNTIRLP